MLPPFLNEFEGRDAPGAALMVIRDGAPVIAEACGLANIAENIPCAVNTNFRLASLTKAFTAMAVMILAERGRVRFDDSLANYLDALPPCGGAVTLRQLLTHTSGVWDYEDLIPGDAVAPVKDRDVGALLRRQFTAYFAPGSNFRYSNSGYALLALVVESVSGVSFAEFLRQNIFVPLKMHDTVAFEDGVSAVSNRARGYTITETGVTETDQDLTSSVLGDGGIYSSISDLFYWDQALFSEKLVSAAILHQAFTPGSRTSDFPGSGYGFGWYLCERRGAPCQWHYGSTCGFSTHVERIPSQKLTVILLANRRDAALAGIVRKIIDAS